MVGEKIRIYTDGSASVRDRTGGWGFVAFCGERRLERSGAREDTTNNEMELTAILEALKSLKRTTHRVTIYTDSQYCQGALNHWHKAWVDNGWISSAGKPVANKELIQEILQERASKARWMSEDGCPMLRRISIRWIKGHNGHEHNERADELAGLARRTLLEAKL